MIEKKTMNWKNIIISNLILLVFMLGCSPKTKKQGEESQLDKPSHEPVIMSRRKYLSKNLPILFIPLPMSLRGK